MRSLASLTFRSTRLPIKRFSNSDAIVGSRRAVPMVSLKQPKPPRASFSDWHFSEVFAGAMVPSSAENMAAENMAAEKMAAEKMATANE